MKKKKIIIIIILLSPFIIWLWYRIDQLYIDCNIELLFHEKEYMSIIELVREELYSPQENYDCEHIYIYHDKIVIDWVNNNHDVEGLEYCEGLIEYVAKEGKYKDRKTEVIYSKTENLADYPTLKSEIVSLLGKNYMEMHFVIDKNGKISAKIPFRKDTFKKKEVDYEIVDTKTIASSSVYTETIASALVYMEPGFSKEQFKELWIMHFNNNLWKKNWEGDCDRVSAWNR